MSPHPRAQRKDKKEAAENTALLLISHLHILIIIIIIILLLHHLPILIPPRPRHRKPPNLNRIQPIPIAHHIIRPKKPDPNRMHSARLVRQVHRDHRRRMRLHLQPDVPRAQPHIQNLAPRQQPLRVLAQHLVRDDGDRAVVVVGLQRAVHAQAGGHAARAHVERGDGADGVRGVGVEVVGRAARVQDQGEEHFAPRSARDGVRLDVGAVVCCPALFAPRLHREEFDLRACLARYGADFV
ncbi:hypothetical protein IWX49DRAFT_221851 [Phyllosticta citricarpa]|uniref:Uncharacterized protein n=2 Tax=Phyllosticta TaxID=121621 RepID=A0ABR1MMS7_9PEZI